MEDLKFIRKTKPIGCHFIVFDFSISFVIYLDGMKYSVFYFYYDRTTATAYEEKGTKLSSSLVLAFSAHHICDLSHRSKSGRCYLGREFLGTRY